DLTNTKWDYTSPFEYDPLQFRKVEIIDLPTGLSINIADYVDYRNKDAGTYHATIEEIQNSNTNYYNPLGDNKYIYNKGDGEFPWTLEWEITTKKLNLTWTTKASENNDFTYYEVVGEEVALIKQDGYLFYADGDYNNATGTATGDPIELSDIEVPKKRVDRYWVVAVLKDSKNYEIVSGKAQRFTVGSLKEMVKVELKDTQPFIYNGNVYGQDIIVTSDEGTLTSAHIDKTYYNVDDRDNPLPGAPTDAGKYVLVLALKDGLGLEDDYELTVREIKFEIEQAEVEIALSKSEYKYDGQEKAGEFVIVSNNYDLSKIAMTYYKETKDFPLSADALPCDAGKYIVELSLPDGETNYKIKSGCEELEFTIAKAQIVAKWVNGENNVPMLSGLDETTKAIVGYV
ncbi:MAG: hypothetical protein K2J13_04740, partial [Clostridia bacterium]|nr:hypothetical protein [Clostridia bacterium]